MTTLTAAELTTPGGPCLDLETRFGRRYRIVPADETEYRETPVGERAWCVEIRCHHGGVYPFGGTRLAAYSRTGVTGGKLRRLPFILSARGDEEVVIVFEAEHLSAVLAILRPYRRRQVSEAERERLREMGAVHRFGRGDGVQGGQTASESTIEAEDDQTDPEAAA